jgi:signal transduction histidine kinase
VTLEPRNVAHDVSETVEAFSPIARASDVTISCNVAPDLRMEADPAAFRQVLLNLFDNAVKFGPGGQVIVVGAEQRNGEVAVSVTDQGRGISERDRSRVFDAYTRVDAPGAPAVTGAGIGLSVVRDLVQAHGGRVWIETPAGTGGTRVVFTLPRSA